MEINKNLFNNYLEYLKEQIIDEMKTTGHYLSGGTADNITVENGQLLVPISFMVLNNGRRSGSFPPIKAIYNWSKLKGINFATDKERMRFAYNTAKKIYNEGITHTTDLISGPIERSEEKLNSIIEQMLDNVLK